jgi:hypothetical protein
MSLELPTDLTEQIVRDAVAADPDRRPTGCRLTLQAPCPFLLLLARFSFTAGYRFLEPHPRHVMMTRVSPSHLIRTLQFSPGTRELPQRLHMNCLRSAPSLTPVLIAICRASSTYLLERAGSFLTISLASLRSISIRSSAIGRRYAMSWRVKVARALVEADSVENTCDWRASMVCAGTLRKEN